MICCAGWVGSGPAAPRCAATGERVRRARRTSWLFDVVLPRPWLIPAGACYAVLTLLAAGLARRSATRYGWGRDESSRTMGAHPVIADGERTDGLLPDPGADPDRLAGLLAASQTESYEIIVVDNASTDGSADAVEAAFPQVRVVRLAENVGFARAVNFGATLARGDWLLLLNPDTEPLGDLLGELVGYARAHPTHRIYAGRTLSRRRHRRRSFGLRAYRRCGARSASPPGSPPRFADPGCATRKRCPAWTGPGRSPRRPHPAAYCWSTGCSSPNWADSRRTTSCTTRTWTCACGRPG